MNFSYIKSKIATIVAQKPFWTMVALQCLALGLYFGDSKACAQSARVSQIAEAVEEHQRASLKIPGGFRQTYRQMVESDAEDNPLYWGELPEGFWCVKYPSFYGETVMSYLQKAKTTRYSCEYDFATKVSKNGTTSLTPQSTPLNVQLVPYPAIYLKSFCAPLRMLFYPEGETAAFEGHEGPRRNLVHCLTKHAEDYTVEDVRVRGLDCVKLTRAGWDELWLVPSRGHQMIRRLLYDGEGKLQSEYECSDFVQVRPGIWQPQKIQQTDHHAGGTAVLKLELEPMRFGVKDSEVRMAIPVGSHVHDQYRAKIYQLGDLSERRIEKSIAAAGRRLPMRQSYVTSLFVLGVVSAALSWIVQSKMLRK